MIGGRGKLWVVFRGFRWFIVGSFILRFSVAWVMKGMRKGYFRFVFDLSLFIVSLFICVRYLLVLLEFIR